MDKKQVKNIATFRSGSLSLCAKFDRAGINRLLGETRSLLALIGDLPATDSARSARDISNMLTSSVLGSAALEGWPITEELAGEVLASGQNRPKSRGKERLLYNLAAAYELALDATNFEPQTHPLLITEEMIKLFHETLTSGLKADEVRPGQYFYEQTAGVKGTPGSLYKSARIASDIKLLMKEFTAWINREEIIDLGPEIRAALAHYHLTLVHPFVSANGAVARLLETMILKEAGLKYIPLMLAGYYRINTDTYRRLFKERTEGDTPDMTPFLDFTLRGQIECLSEIKEVMVSSLRTLALSDHYRRLREEKLLTRCQGELLSVLLNHSAPFTLKDMIRRAPFKAVYRDVSERTARRDIEKLLRMELLLETEAKNYRLNTKALG